MHRVVFYNHCASPVELFAIGYPARMLRLTATRPLQLARRVWRTPKMMLAQLRRSRRLRLQHRLLLPRLLRLAPRTLLWRSTHHHRPPQQHRLRARLPMRLILPLRRWRRRLAPAMRLMAL